MLCHFASRWLALVAVAALGVVVSSPASAESTHVVGPGHTLAKIARRYHVSIEALREANNLAPGQKLKPGQRIVVPDKPSEAAASTGARRPAPSPSARDEERDSRQELRQATRPGSAEPYAQRARRPGTVTLSRGSEQWSGKTLARKPRLAPGAADAFRRMLRDASGTSHAIDPRLIALVTQISDHFGGRPIEIVSGYRRHTEAQHTAHSSHNVGKAIDFAIRGVPNEALRDYCHKLTAVGVGYYPNSSFVHLDVRSTTTHWVDESGPGEPPRYTSVTNGQLSALQPARGQQTGRASGARQAAARGEAEK